MKLNFIGLNKGRLVSGILKYISLLPPFQLKIYWPFIFIVGTHARIVRAQATDLAYTITYVSDSRTTYLINDPLEKFPIGDQVKLLPEIVKDSVVREVFNDNSFKVTIFHLENNKFEEWMTKPAKTVIDFENTIVYDNSEKVITTFSNSKKHHQNYLALQDYVTVNHKQLTPVFIALSDDTKKMLKDAGFQSMDIGDGSVMFYNDTAQIIINDLMHINELIVNKKDGSFNYSIKKRFKFNPEGQLIPAYTIEKRINNRFPANCVQQLKITEYPYYNVTGIKFRVDPDGNNFSENAEISVFPNPANNIIGINFPACTDPLKLIISDNTGRLISEQTLDPGTTYIDADISKFESGVYFIEIFNDNTYLAKTFLKN